jgi:hypothetical protein
MKGESAIGGSRPQYRRRVGDEEWEQLLAGRKAPANGRGTPMNIIRRPVDLPPMVPIKNAGGETEFVQ